MLERRSVLAALCVVVLLASVPLAYRFFHPFVTLADNGTARYGQAARNFMRYGPVMTRLGLVTDMGEEGPPFTYFAHHPPLATLGAGAAFLALGVGDWVARLYPAACTLLSAVVLFVLWGRRRGVAAGTLAAVMMAALPAFGHFGKMLGGEAPSLLFGLLTILFYVEWKEAADGRGAWRLPACLTAFAAGCFSDWTGFYPGLAVTASAALSLRGARRRRVLLGLGIAGLACFTLVAVHLAYLSGDPRSVLRAASDRTLAAGSGDAGNPGLAAWFRREGESSLRLFGDRAPIFAGLGALSAILAAARRRAPAGAIATALMIAAPGAIHPFVVFWATYNHDWILFHLMPIVAVAAAEGVLLLAAAASALASLARTPDRVRIAAGAAVLLAGAGVAFEAEARGLRTLAEETPGFAWPILGREIARRAPEGTRVLANFAFNEFRSAPARFYADRTMRSAGSLALFDERLSEGGASLYLRDMNLPIDAALEEALERHPEEDLGPWRFYDLGRSRGPVEPAHPAGGSSGGGSLDAVFDNVVKLTGFSWSVPAGRPSPASPIAAYLGLTAGRIGPAGIIRVTSFWKPEAPSLPDWQLFVAVTRKAGKDGWLSLPPLTLPEAGHPLLSRFKGSSGFRIESAFFLADGYPGGDYEIRFALYDRGTPVTPEIPGPKVQGLKAVVAGSVRLPG